MTAKRILINKYINFHYEKLLVSDSDNNTNASLRFLLRIQMDIITRITITTTTKEMATHVVLLDLLTNNTILIFIFVYHHFIHLPIAFFCFVSIMKYGVITIRSRPSFFAIAKTIYTISIKTVI